MKNARVLGASIVVASAVLAAGCAPSIRSERDANIPVPRGATWAWAGGPAAPTRDTGGRRYISSRYASATVDPIVRQRFVRAMDGAMTARGFTRVEDTTQADFLLSFSFGGQPVYAARPVMAPAVSVGWYGGWGYRPWGFYRPFGFYRPWGFGWAPWGWGLGFAAVPAYGYDAGPAYGYGGRPYREASLVVQLRLRSDGEVAWIGRYRTNERDVRGMSDAQLQAAVTKLFATLR